ncbi:MAG: hypothetical protein ABI574_05325 [Burkholderiales bacterium]
MNEPYPPADVPTLTEVIGPVDELPSAVVLPLRVVREAPRPIEAPAFAETGLDEDALVDDVLRDVQLQVDRLLEYRLKDAMGPLLERVVVGVLQEARDELAATLQDVVRKAVAQALARRRGP